MSFGDRRAPMKRTGFQRKAPVNTARKARPPVKVRATRRISEERAYAKLRAEMLPANDPKFCEAGWRLAAEGVEVRCTATATQLHHLRKRSSSGALANPANVVRTCGWCNTEGIEGHPVEAEAAGLVLREGHPDWEAMSAREWRKGQC